MNIDPTNILRVHQDDPSLGVIAKQALLFVEGASCKFPQAGGPGQSSLAVVRMYEIRKGLKNFKSNAFVGLEESIKCLRECGVGVHLSVIETEKGIISLWLAEESGLLLGIVIAKFET